MQFSYLHASNSIFIRVLYVCLICVDLIQTFELDFLLIFIIIFIALPKNIITHNCVISESLGMSWVSLKWDFEVIIDTTYFGFYKNEDLCRVLSFVHYLCFLHPVKWSIFHSSSQIGTSIIQSILWNYFVILKLSRWN